MGDRSRSKNRGVDIPRISRYIAPVIAKDLIAASARPLLLSVLATGENYGYAIIHQVRELSQGTLEWKEGMLYPVLHRLEREGLVVSEWKESEVGRRRKYYRLSEPGHAALAEEKKDWLSVHNVLASVWKIKPFST